MNEILNMNLYYNEYYWTNSIGINKKNLIKIMDLKIINDDSSFRRFFVKSKNTQEY